MDLDGSLTGTSNGGTDRDAILDPPQTSQTGTTRKMSVVITTTGADGNPYTMIYTPKAFHSDEELQIQDIEDFFHKHLLDNRLSRAGVQIQRALAETHVNMSAIVSSKSSMAGAESPSHLPDYSKKSLDLLKNATQHDEQSDLDSIQHMNTKRIRWGSQQDTRVISTENRKTVSMTAMTLETTGNRAEPHIPPEMRKRIGERLLDIRDLIVEIVTILRSTGYGGEDFQWSPKSLLAYGITNPPDFKIPQAFQNFAVNDTRSS